MISATQAVDKAHEISTRLYTEYLDKEILRAVEKGERSFSLADPATLKYSIYVSPLDVPQGQRALWRHLSEARQALHLLGYVTDIVEGESKIGEYRRYLKISW